MPSAAVRAVERSVRGLLRAEPRIVLAVSGGRDSMTLLHAVARARTSRHVVIVATMDHGTGPHARAGAALVARVARQHGIVVRIGRARADVPRTEAALREARWAFLRAVAARERATIVTAHTRDDQIETVVMRILRGAGARGLAGLAAASDVQRPLLDHPRAAIDAYVRHHAVRWVDDPTNRSRAFFRNRVRLDLLPAIRRVRPRFESEMLDLSRRAARVRAALDEAAQDLVDRVAPGLGSVEAAPLRALDDVSLRALWPALAGRLNVVLDRRGTERLAHFTRHAGIGARMPLSGGVEVVRERTRFTVRHIGAAAPPAAEPVPLGDALRFGRFRFEVVPGTATFPQPLESGAEPWLASLPGDGAAQLSVRAWTPGDRMKVRGTGPGGGANHRRIKRLFADAHIAGPLREGWPVVLLDDQIVWVPGVRRGPDAEATARADRASIVYRCRPD